MTGKDEVAAFWEAASCGEDLYLKGMDLAAYEEQSRIRYDLEPFIPPFLAADEWAGKTVLEIGVGLGADHQLLAQGGARLTGVDLTDRALAHTRRRFELAGLSSDLRTGDAERLPFADNTFDAVYSWGVIHHSPDTPAAAREILRVLKPGGAFRVMIYNKWSLVGMMLWVRYGLMVGRPGRTMAEIYSEHLESPGTKAYTLAGARDLFRGADNVEAWSELTHADLLSSGAGQRHTGLALTVARKLWPRWLLRRVAAANGCFLLIKGTKPSG